MTVVTDLGAGKMRTHCDCFPNFDSFCHHAQHLWRAQTLCPGHKKIFLKIFRNTSCVRAVRNNVATFRHGRAATSWDTILLSQCVVVLLGPYTGLHPTFLQTSEDKTSKSLTERVRRLAKNPQTQFNLRVVCAELATHEVSERAMIETCPTKTPFSALDPPFSPSSTFVSNFTPTPTVTAVVGCSFFVQVFLILFSPGTPYNPSPLDRISCCGPTADLRSAVCLSGIQKCWGSGFAIYGNLS